MHALAPLVVLMTLVVCTYSQCAPPQFEASRMALSNINAITRKTSPIHLEKARISYDAINTRYAVSFELDTVGHTPQKYRIIDLHQGNSGMRYVVQENDGKCFVQALKTGFPKLCLGGVRHDGDSYIGLKSDGFLVSDYTRIHDGVVSSSVVKKNDDGTVVPIEETRAGYIDGQPAIETQRYSDVTRGISDESVFDVPPQCGSFRPNRLINILKFSRDHSIFEI